MNLIYDRFPNPKNGLVLLAVVLMIGFTVERSYHLLFVEQDSSGTLFAVWTVCGVVLAAWLMRREIVYRDEAIQQLRQILDLIGEGFSMIDWRTTNYVEVNNAFCQLLGYQRHELIGRPSVLLNAPTSAKRLREFSRELGRKGTSQIELDYVRPNGTAVRLKISAALLRDPRGRPVRAISFVTDITNAWQAEQNAIAAKERIEAASRAKNRFLMSMSHELRTPLNAIIGFSDLLLNPKTEPQVAEKRIEYLSDIRSSGHTLLDLVGNVIDMARIEADEFDLLDQAVDLKDVAARIIRQMRPRASTKNIAIEFQAPEVLPELYGDLRSINRMIGNLLSNAIKFSGDGARVAVTLALEADKGLSVAISDTGPGIPPAAMATIFEPFSANPSDDIGKKEGSRLGLAVTKHLIEAHGGRIEIVSQPGQGTTATLYFPRERTALDDIA